MGDLGDPPACGAQRDDIAWSGLVDHLLVEFAYPGGLFGLGGQIHREQAAVGNGAPGSHRQSLCAGPGGQRAGVSVVDQPGPQFGKVGGRVLSRQQIKGGLESAARQCRERGAAAHGIEPHVGAHRFQRAGRHRLLGQNVEGVGRNPHGFDGPGQHPLGGDRAVDQVGAVLGQQHAAGDLTDLMAGPADPLQAAGHRRRRLHLNDQIDRAHIDAEFQTGSGDHRSQASGLQIVFDGCALFFGHRAVVGPGQQRFGTLNLVARQHVRRWPVQLDAVAFGVNLVDAGREPLGKPS